MERLLFVVLVVTNTLVHSAEKTTEKVPIWSVNPSAAAKLAKNVDGGWFSIRPPEKYLQAELDDTAYEKAGIKIAAWTRNSDQVINPTITIMSLPAQRVPAENDKEIFEGILKSLTARWPDARGSKIIQGRWNGGLAYRYEFSAKSKEDNIAGIVFAKVTAARTFVVSALHTSNTPEDRDAIKTLELSAMSCSQK